MEGLEGALNMGGYARANPNQASAMHHPSAEMMDAAGLAAAASNNSNKALQMSAPAGKPVAAPKFKKAPDAPKRFKSAFIIFSAEKHKEIKEEFAKTGRTEKTTDIAKLVSEAWREMAPEEKESWEKKARKDKARYEVEKSMYKGPWKIPANKRTPKDPTAPKRPMSAFLAFSNKRRAALKRETPDATNADLSKMLSKTWKEAPEELRRKYMDEEAELRAGYKVEMAKWRKRVAEEKRQEREEREAVAMQAAESRQNDPPPAGPSASATAGGGQQGFDLASAGGVYNPYAMGLNALQGVPTDPSQYANLMAAGSNPFGASQGFSNAAAQQQLLNSLFSQQLKGGAAGMQGNLGMYGGFGGMPGLGGMQGQGFVGMPQAFGNQFGGLGGLGQGGMDAMATQRAMLGAAQNSNQQGGQQQPMSFSGQAPGMFAGARTGAPAMGQQQQQGNRDPVKEEDGDDDDNSGGYQASTTV